MNITPGNLFIITGWNDKKKLLNAAQITEHIHIYFYYLLNNNKIILNCNAKFESVSA